MIFGFVFGVRVEGCGGGFGNVWFVRFLVCFVVLRGWGGICF